MYGIFMKAGSFIKTGIIKKVSPNYFTGKASLQIISGTPKPKEADVLHVKFHKGARTKIHAQNTNQRVPLSAHIRGKQNVCGFGFFLV